MGGTITEKELREQESRQKAKAPADNDLSDFVEKMRQVNDAFAAATHDLQWRDRLSLAERSLLDTRIQGVIARHVERRELGKRLLEARVQSGVLHSDPSIIVRETLQLVDTFLDQAYADQSNTVQAIEEQHKTGSWLRRP